MTESQEPQSEQVETEANNGSKLHQVAMFAQSLLPAYGNFIIIATKTLDDGEDEDANVCVGLTYEGMDNVAWAGLPSLLVGICEAQQLIGERAAKDAKEYGIDLVTALINAKSVRVAETNEIAAIAEPSESVEPEQAYNGDEA